MAAAGAIFGPVRTLAKGVGSVQSGVGDCSEGRRSDFGTQLPFRVVVQEVDSQLAGFAGLNSKLEADLQGR